MRPARHGKAREVPAEAEPEAASSAVPAENASSARTSPSSPSTIQNTEPQPPIHLFANIPEAQYIPPSTRNFAAPADKASKDKKPAYRTAAPIQNPKVAKEVYERSMKAPFITLSPAELLALSPDYCQKLRDSVTPKRIFPADGKSDQPLATHLYEEALPFADTNIQCY